MSPCEFKRILLGGGWQRQMGACVLILLSLADFSWLELPAAHHVYINESYLSPERDREYER